MAHFYGRGSNLSRLEPLRGGSLPFTIKFPEIPGTHFIDLGRMKGWVDLAATQWFWKRDPWIGNPAPYLLFCQKLNIMSNQFGFSMEGTYMDFGNSKNSKTPNIKTSYSDISSCWERNYSNKTDTDSCASFLLIANLGIHTHCKQPLKSSMFKDM